MTRLRISSRRLFISLLLFLLLCCKNEALTINTSLPALIFKSNFTPYGKDYPHHIPAGRFTNGNLVTDFIISYMGIKEEVPAYLDPKLSVEELLTGVSFASSGAGYDPLTAQLTGVLSIPEQLDYFKEYIGKIRRLIGNQPADNLVRQSVYVVSCGINDFIVNYFTVPIQRKKYSVEEYQQFVLKKFGEFLQGLRRLGARKVIVAGILPFGCLPAIITLNPTDKYPNRDCIGSYNSVARDYNQKLERYLGMLEKSSGWNGAKLIYVDVYKPLADMIHNPNKFGFEEWRLGCCGTGQIEVAFLCNQDSIVCPDASKYVFWDSVHPTEWAYYLIFKSLRGIIDNVLYHN